MRKLFILTTLIIVFIGFLSLTVNVGSIKAFQLTPFIPTSTSTFTRTPTPTIVILPWATPTPTKTNTPVPTATYNRECRLVYCTPTPTSPQS